MTAINWITASPRVKNKPTGIMIRAGQIGTCVIPNLASPLIVDLIAISAVAHSAHANTTMSMTRPTATAMRPIFADMREVAKVTATWVRVCKPYAIPQNTRKTSPSSDNSKRPGIDPRPSLRLITFTTINPMITIVMIALSTARYREHNWNIFVNMANLQAGVVYLTAY